MYIVDKAPRFRQGDILRGVQLIEWAEVVDTEVQFTERTLQYCVVLSQECDLEQDFNSRADEQKLNPDKFLQSILLCPAFPAEQVKMGTHLEELHWKMHQHSTGEWDRVKKYNNYRYHFLPENDGIQLPALALDFKQYITIPRKIAYRDEIKASVLASLDDLFREHLSNRFAHYLSRIGLPDLSS